MVTLQGKHKLWRRVNRCVLCGTRLQYTPTVTMDRKDPEGEKYCQQNHDRFSVRGYFDAEGEWQFLFVLPKTGKRHQ